VPKIYAVIKVTLSALIIIFGRGRHIINKFKCHINLKLKNRKKNCSQQENLMSTKLCIATFKFPKKILLEVILNLYMS